METGVEIAFHHMDHSPAVEERVRARIARLEQFHGRLTSCRVVIDAPHKTHRKGNHYEVRLEVHAPSARFVVDRAPGDVNAHEDLMVAVRDAFDAMERQIRRWTEQHSGRPETQAPVLHGRVAEIDGAGGFGQIALTDGRLVYFHRNAVVEGDFDALVEGDPVEIAIDTGDSAKGPHASTVRSVSETRFAALGD